MTSKTKTKTSAAKPVLVDYQRDDYRAFLFVQHEVHGLLMLRCTRKKSKPPHWQLPGGHIDEAEFVAAAGKKSDRESQLLLAGKAGAARELFEETGIDVRSLLFRLVPAKLRKKTKSDKDGTKLLANEHKHRLFFFLTVRDDDFPKSGKPAMGTASASCQYKHIRLRLSVEHSGFTFQEDAKKAIEMLTYHSGGKVSYALWMAMGSVEGDSPEKSSPTATEESTEVNDVERTIPSFEIPPPPEKKGMFCCFRGQ